MIISHSVVENTIFGIDSVGDSVMQLKELFNVITDAVDEKDLNRIRKIAALGEYLSDNWAELLYKLKENLEKQVTTAANAA